MATNNKRALKKPDVDWILLAMTLFEATAFLMLAFYKGFDFVPLVLAVSMPLLLLAQVLLLGRAFPHMDKYILIVANFFCGVGMIMLHRLAPGNALKQLLFYGVGILAMMVMTFMVARFRFWRMLKLPMMALSLGLLALTLVIGKETYGAKNWIDLKFFSLQPSEFVKVALVVCLALDLSEKRTIGTLIPVGVFAVACVGLICLQKDLGAVLICFMIAVAAYFTATSNWLLCLGGFAAANRKVGRIGNHAVHGVGGQQRLNGTQIALQYSKRQPVGLCVLPCRRCRCGL